MTTVSSLVLRVYSPSLPVYLSIYLSQDSSMDEILEFFDKAEAAGANVPSVISPQVDISGEGSSAAPSSHHTVSFEARQLKNLFLKLYDN